MRQEDINYIESNMLLFTTSRRYAPGELQMIFDIYNRITGENKKTSSCGRCVETTKKTVLHYYDKNRD